MEHARVLIVDDSLTMRALFSGVLERARGIEVVGMAANADEAREMMIRLKPNVITLDVEMPGMSGIEFLEEIMRERPTPVVMLSTLTQKGAEISFRALELGAVDCFPKPQNATPEEFNELAPKLAALVIAASQGKVRIPKRGRSSPHTAFEWNGRIVGMSASTGGVDAMLQILPQFPINCPPTIVVLPLETGLVSPLVKHLQASCVARVAMVEDGMELPQGTIALATDLAHHVVVDRWPDPGVRLIRSDPVGGFRPSASLLYATLARTAGANAIGCILTGLGADGAAGLKALRDAGGTTFAQDAASCLVSQTPDAARAAGGVIESLPLDQIAGHILASCRTIRDAA